MTIQYLLNLQKRTTPKINGKELVSREIERECEATPLHSCSILAYFHYLISALQYFGDFTFEGKPDFLSSFKIFSMKKLYFINPLNPVVSFG